MRENIYVYSSRFINMFYSIILPSFFVFFFSFFLEYNVTIFFFLFFLSKIMLPSCSPCRVRPSQSKWPRSLTPSWVTDPRRKWRKRRSRPRRPSNATRRSWRSTTSHRPPGGRSRPRSVSLGQASYTLFSDPVIQGL